MNSGVCILAIVRVLNFLLFISVVLSSISCKNNEMNKDLVFSLLDKPVVFTKNELENTKLGFYQSLPNKYGGTAILIKSKNKYEFVRSGCLGGSLDSGKVIFKSDSAMFTSLIGMSGMRLGQSKNGSNKIPGPNNEVAFIEKFIFKKNKLISLMDSGLVLYKRGIPHFHLHKRDRKGRIYGVKIDSSGNIVERGYYLNRTLKKGSYYDYQGVLNKSNQPIVSPLL